MKNFQKVHYFDLIKLYKKIINPFSRTIFIADIKKEFGEGFVIFYDLGNGIAIYVRNLIPKKNLILVEECNVSGGSLIFNFSSNIKFIYKDKKEHILKKDFFLLGLSSNKFYVEVPLEKEKPLLEFVIGIKEELFLKLAHPIKNIQEYMKKAHKQGYYVLKDLQIDTLQVELFNNFKDQKSFEDILKNIYLESKASTLLHHTIERIAQTFNKSIDKNRISSLERAKEIILQEYSQNLSIKNIAYKSAINECYLKKDFKEYFGMTIADMLQKRRLEVAKELLRDNFNVKEVAIKVGYKHSGHFSKLFFNYYHIIPSSYKKQFTSQ